MTFQRRAHKLNDSAKQTMRQRVVSASVMVVYFVVLFLFAILSDRINTWAPLRNNLLGQQINGFLLIFWTMPLIFIIAKEICNIYFRFKIAPYVVVTLAMLSLVYSPTLLYFFAYYDIAQIRAVIDVGNAIFGLQLTNIFTIVLLSNVLITCFVAVVLLLSYKQFTFKNWVIFSLLMGVASGFFIGIYFFNYVHGWTTLLFLFLITVMMDSFAYFGGVFFGKHKMAPVISPKKTWEGFAIALASTLVISVVILVIYAFADSHGTSLLQIFGIQFGKLEGIENPTNEIIYNMPLDPNFVTRTKAGWWGWMIVIILSFSVISVLGDLCYSAFKRKYRIKDYGNLIPGHGGILDRIDSHSFVFSFYFILTFFLHLFAKTAVLLPNIAIA